MRKEGDVTKGDRDRSIEQLLRRALPPESAIDGGCPDAETLAALADRTLAAPLRRDVEAHVADCHRCQALTAAMARADQAGAAAGDTAAALPWWGNRRLLNWLAPAAAAATAVALMIAVPGWRTQLSAPPPETSKTASAPSAATPSIVTPASKLSVPTPSAAAPPTAPAPAQEAPSRDAPQAPSDERANFRARADQAEGRVEGGKVEGQAGAREAVGGLAPSAPVDERFAAPAEAPAESTLGKASQDLAARNEAVASEADRQLREQAAPAASALADAVGALTTPFEVISPDPRIRWRVGPAAAVQYSRDAGASWEPQQTGTVAQLTAGASPSPTVCWLVGRAGTVLRTTDGGRRWERVRFPEAVDLVALVGSTALNATVDLVDGRRLGTTDGGQTWAPLRE